MTHQKRQGGGECLHEFILQELEKIDSSGCSANYVEFSHISRILGIMETLTLSEDYFQKMIADLERIHEECNLNGEQKNIIADKVTELKQRCQSGN